MDDDTEETAIAEFTKKQRKRFCVQMVVETIPQLLVPMQILLSQVTIQELEDMLHEMNDEASKMCALPFPETIAKSEVMMRKNKLYERIIELAKAQKDLLDNPEQKVTAGQKVLNALMGMGEEGECEG